MRHLIRADFSVIACNSYPAPDKCPAKSGMYYVVCTRRARTS